MTILLQRRHKVGHLLGSIPLPEDGLFANAGDGRGFLGRRTALAAGALAQPAHQMRGDDHPLDLVGALVDGGDLGVAVGPLHLHALEEAAAAVDLQGVIGDLQRDVRGVHLRHGRLHAVGRVLLLQLRRGVDEEPGAAQLGGHICQLEGDALLGRDGLAELDALLGIAQRVLKRALGDAQRLGGDADASAVQRGHGDLEAVPLLAQQVFLGNLHIVEDQFRRGGGANAHLVIVVAELKALPALLHDESGDAPGADVRRGDGENHIGVRLRGVGNEDLAAVKEVVVPLIQRRSLRAAGVGSGVGLRETEGADLLALGQRNQIFLLLLLGAVGENRP